jgi:hypothetical protein
MATAKPSWTASWPDHWRESWTDHWMGRFLGGCLRSHRGWRLGRHLGWTAPWRVLAWRALAWTVLAMASWTVTAKATAKASWTAPWSANVTGERCHCFLACYRKKWFSAVSEEWVFSFFRVRHFYQFDIGTGRNNKKLDASLTASWSCPDTSLHGRCQNDFKKLSNLLLLAVFCESHIVHVQHVTVWIQKYFR